MVFFLSLTKSGMGASQIYQVWIKPAAFTLSPKVGSLRGRGFTYDQDISFISAQLRDNGNVLQRYKSSVFSVGCF